MRYMTLGKLVCACLSFLPHKMGEKQRLVHRVSTRINELM